MFLETSATQLRLQEGWTVLGGTEGRGPGLLLRRLLRQRDHLRLRQLRQVQEVPGVLPGQGPESSGRRLGEERLV